MIAKGHPDLYNNHLFFPCRYSCFVEKWIMSSKITSRDSCDEGVANNLNILVSIH